MIENQMLNYKEQRLSYSQYADVQTLYKKIAPAKDREQGCIVKLSNGREFRRLV